MRALGEDPARFEALKQELSASFSTGDPFVEKQVDDLARLYWRRDRLERSQTGLMRRALLALEEEQHRRRKEIEDCTIEVGAGHQRHARGAHRPRRAPAPAAFLSGTDSLAGARPLLPGLAGRRAPGLLPEQDRLARGAVVLSAVALRGEQPASAAGWRRRTRSDVGRRRAQARRRG